MRRDALLSFCLLFINTSRNDMEDCDNDNKLLLGDFITSFLLSSFVLHRLQVRGLMCNFYLPVVFNLLIQCMNNSLKLFKSHNSLSLGQIGAFKLKSCIRLSLPVQCSYFSSLTCLHLCTLLLRQSRRTLKFLRCSSRWLLSGVIQVHVF